MSTVKVIFKNMAVVMTGTMMIMILSILFTILLARHLGTAGYGLYVYATSLVTIFINLTEFGMSQIAIRDVAKEKENANYYLSNIFVIRAVLSLASMAVIFVIVRLLRDSASDRDILYLFASGSFFIMVAAGLRWVFFAYQKLEYEAFLNVTQTSLSLMFVVLLVIFRQSLLMFAFYYMIISMIMLLLTIFLIRRNITKFSAKLNWDFMRKMVASALPLGVVAITTAIYLNMDKLMLSAFRGDTETGIYGAAFRLTAYMRILLITYTTPVLLPALAELSVNSLQTKFMKLLDKSFHFMVAVCLAASLGTVLISKQLIMLFFGEKFINAVIPLSIVVWVLPFIGAHALLSYAMISIGRQDKVMVACLSGMIVNLILNLSLIPSYGSIGAALSMVISDALIATIIIIYASRYLSFKPSIKKVLRIAVAAAIMGITTYYLRAMNIYILIVISSVAYFISLIIMKVITKEEWGLLKKALISSPRESYANLGVEEK